LEQRAVVTTASVHYDVSGVRTESELRLARCVRVCLATYRIGDPVEIGYDPNSPSRSVLAINATAAQ